MNFGDTLYDLIRNKIFKVLDLGEKIHVIGLALKYYSDDIKSSPNKEFKTDFPIGYSEDDGIWKSPTAHSKGSILTFIKEHCKDSLPIDGIANLTTIMEVTFSDLLFKIIQKYPKKLSDKYKIEATKIYEVGSIEELQYYVIKKMLNDITYKSPDDFIKDFKDLSGIDLKDCEPYNKYIEIKATRDIFVHSDGVANEIYVKKAKKLGRAKEGEVLQCDLEYFYQSYEVCFNILEFLEDQCHQKWHSVNYERKGL